jgi:hypothetical protein
VLGLQVKTVEVTRDRLRATVNVRGSSFKPSPTTYFVVLAWLRDERQFHADCLVLPSMALPDLARDDGNGHISFEFRPEAEDDETAAYRRPIASLGSEVAARLSG